MLAARQEVVAARTESVPAVERAFVILELLAGSTAGLTLPDIVEATGLPKSTVHCLLVTLQRRGYLHRNAITSRYMFGLKLFSLGNMALSGLTLREQAMPFLKKLVGRVHLTTHMAILEHREAVVVIKIEPPGIFRLATWVGKRMGVHCTSLGKALIAGLPAAEIDAIIREHGLPRHNEHTICSRERLKRDLAKTARLGYAVDDEEDEIGLRCIGVPVHAHDGSVIASISIAGATSQITSDNLSAMAAIVIETAAALSQSLGHTGAKPPIIPAAAAAASGAR